MATTVWTKRLIIIAPKGTLTAARKNALGQMFSDVTGETLSNESRLFGVGLSASGQDPVTHYATSTVVTGSIVGNVRSYVDSNMLPGSKWWELDADTGVLTAKSAGASGTIGQVWSWRQAIESTNLEIVVPF